MSSVIIKFRDYHALKGLYIEYAAKATSNEETQNRPIFICSKLDCVYKLISNYRPDCEFVSEIVSFLKENSGKIDVIESEFEDVAFREPICIKFYEINP